MGASEQTALVPHRTGDAPVLRPARPSDAESVAALMRASILELFPGYYDEKQTASAAVHIAHADMTIIEDGTYFVHEVGDDIVGCGGWSRRGKLFTGSGSHEGDDRLLDPRAEAAHIRAMFVRRGWTRRGLGRSIFEASQEAAVAEGFRTLDLMATLPGLPFYQSCGFHEVERCALAMPDGVLIEGVRMERRSLPRAGEAVEEDPQRSLCEGGHAAEGGDAQLRRVEGPPGAGQQPLASTPPALE